MVQINFGQREVSCKVVFYGPGRSGKTTNLEIIHQKAPDKAKGEMVSIATETDRTLYFDYLPLDLGQVGGMHTKFQLYTVPGQIYYNATRKLVLQGVDGVIFVADSAEDKLAENLESLQNLRDNLAEMNLNLDDLPLVIQYNKRDVPNAQSVEMLQEQLNPMNVPNTTAVACNGEGVFQTLKVISKLVIDKLNSENSPSGQRRRTAELTPSGQSKPIPPATPTPVATPPVPPLPAAPMPVQPAVTPAAAPPVQSSPPQPSRPQSLRSKHLSKPAPPKLQKQGNLPKEAADLGATDPNLRQYKDGDYNNKNSSTTKNIILILLTIIILTILFAILVVFYKPVQDAIAPYLPPKVMEIISLEEKLEEAKPIKEVE